MKRIIALSLSLALGIPATACAQGITPPAQTSGLAPRPSPADARTRAAAVWALIKASGYSGAVRIDIGDDTILRDASGFADISTRRPFTPDTQFEIGSLTKPFTAAAILKLQDDGRLSTNDPLSKFFPDVPADKAGITLHQLLTHSAGFPLVIPPVGSGNSDLEPLGRAEFLRRAFATPLLFEPGSRIEYSNGNYSLLAAVVEVVSGQDYETYLKSRVLAPAGAIHTGYASVLDDANAVHAPDGRGIVACCWAEGGPYWNLLGNGGLMSTLDDFVTWRRAFAQGRIVSAAAVRQAGTGWVAEKDGPGREGYGWIIATSPTRGRVELAAGGNRYFTTEMLYYPDYDMVVLATSNGGQSPGAVTRRLVAAMFGEPDVAAPAGGSRTSESALADAFATALLDADEADRHAFIAAKAGPVFVSREGVPAISARFDALHELVAGARVTEVDVGQDRLVRITLRMPSGEIHVIEFGLGGTPNDPRVAGFSQLS